MNLISQLLSSLAQLLYFCSPYFRRMKVNIVWWPAAVNSVPFLPFPVRMSQCTINLKKKPFKTKTQPRIMTAGSNLVIRIKRYFVLNIFQAKRLKNAKQCLDSAFSPWQFAAFLCFMVLRRASAHVSARWRVLRQNTQTSPPPVCSSLVACLEWKLLLN